jgi:hypothetical protein
MSSSTFSDIASGPVELCARQTGKWSEVHAGGHPCGTEVNTRDDPGPEYPTADPEEAGWWCRSDAQCAPQRVDRVLRTIYALSVYPLFRYVDAMLLAWARRNILLPMEIEPPIVHVVYNRNSWLDFGGALHSNNGVR